MAQRCESIQSTKISSTLAFQSPTHTFSAREVTNVPIAFGSNPAHRSRTERYRIPQKDCDSTTPLGTKTSSLRMFGKIPKLHSRQFESSRADRLANHSRMVPLARRILMISKRQRLSIERVGDPQAFDQTYSMGAHRRLAVPKLKRVSTWRLIWGVGRDG